MASIGRDMARSLMPAGPQGREARMRPSMQRAGFAAGGSLMALTATGTVSRRTELGEA